MWWGGFSEAWHSLHFESHRWVLIPMWWGGFSELAEGRNYAINRSLNPHVVGRFFRDTDGAEFAETMCVLIPMWWGGFSEPKDLPCWIAYHVLIPMWWGGFSESGGVFSLLNSAG